MTGRPEEFTPLSAEEHDNVEAERAPAARSVRTAGNVIKQRSIRVVGTESLEVNSGEETDTPSVVFHRRNGHIHGAEVQCTCGRSVVLEFDFGEEYSSPG